MTTDASTRVMDLLDGAGPRPGSYFVKPALEQDESEWFLRTLDAGLIVLGECQVTCPRRRKYGVSARDEFLTPSGQHRHLFSFPFDRPRLNREYVPHIAAWGRAIIGGGYSAERASFSRYRAFRRDAITKSAGTGYETDGEFDAPDGSLWLHLEVKRDSRSVEAITSQIDRARDLAKLPRDTIKEIEYVLDLAPKYLWIVGPGTVDPPRHVFAVDVTGKTARFQRLSALPAPPGPVGH